MEGSSKVAGGMLVLSRSDLEAILSPSEVIPAVEEAFHHYATRDYRLVPRQALPLNARDVLLFMCAYLPKMKALGTKSITVCFENPARGLPSLAAVYLLHDPETGQPLALMEAGFLTGIRTGATSAVAARRLARQNAEGVACFGAGVQAAFQLRCLKAVLPLRWCHVVSRSRERAEAFARRMGQELAIECAVVASAAEAVRQADVVIAATTSPTPVFDGRDLRPGTHIDAVGAFQPTTRELDTEAVSRARVVVDTYEGALRDAGDLLIPIGEGAITRAHIAAELAEIIAGIRPGRTRDDEITCFKSVGCAIEDAATARLAYDRALAAGRGLRVELG